MKVIAASLVLFSACFPHVAIAQQSVALRRPTIVILIDTPAEIKRQRNDHEYNEATGDFAVYANRMVEALKTKRDFRIQWSSASLVRFPATTFKPVLRHKVGGWGYVFYRPGHEPIIIEGVAVDDQLVSTAVRLFEVKVEGYPCGA
jgi:hypothetical protein